MSGAILSCILFFQGCSEAKASSNKIDKELKPYVESWSKVFKKKITFDIVVDNTPSPFVGLCYYDYSINKYGVRYVVPTKLTIQTEFFRRMKISDKGYALELVLGHELIHCLQNKPEHNNKLLSDGCPASLMIEHFFSVTCYKKHRRMYWDEVRNAK